MKKLTYEGHEKPNKEVFEAIGNSEWWKNAKKDDAIPITQLEAWQKQFGNKVTFGTIMKFVEEWRKENESNIND